jgi:hypothetical protein
MEITWLDNVDLGLDRPGTRRRVLPSVDHQTLGRGAMTTFIGNVSNGKTYSLPKQSHSVLS